MPRRHLSSPIPPEKQKGLKMSPWIVLGACVILLVVVLALAVQNINREKAYMSGILSEKGAAIIKAVEAGARTGMMGMMGGDHLQTLLEETGKQPDIRYLAVTDQAGRILAHSDPARINALLKADFSAYADMDAGEGERWDLSTSEDDGKVFEVYRHFKPLPHSHSGMHGRRMGRGMMHHMTNWRGNTDQADRMIFAGLDVAPFESARQEDIRNTVIISAVLLLLGVLGFISLFWAEGFRRTRRMLQDASAFADEMVTSLPAGLIASDRTGRIAFFNASAEKITGLSFAAVRGKFMQDVLPALCAEIRQFIETGAPMLEKETECVFSEDAAAPVSLSASKIINEAGDFVGDMVILRDLSEVRRLQETVRKQEKLAAVGRLAAGVAHEIRNPLSSIKGLAAYFSEKFDKGSEDREVAEVMAAEVDRLNRVVTELLELARPSELRFKTADLNAVLDHSLRLIRQDAEVKGVAVRFSPGDGVGRVRIDEDRLSQCLLNLYLNAVQAMPDGGVLSVGSKVKNDGRGVVIEIGDDGAGIEKADLEKIFEPYFTRKPSGTGLGLAIVQKIVEAHQGAVRVTSAPGQGTLVALTLPVDQERNDHDA